MKIIKFTLQISLIVMLFLSFPIETFSGRGCTGSANCTACKSCKGCKHCAKQGGTCGVCYTPPVKAKKTKSKKEDKLNVKDTSAIIDSTKVKKIKKK